MKSSKEPKDKKTYKPKLEPYTKRVKVTPTNIEKFIKKDDEE
jgi:hypothetical protein